MKSFSQNKAFRASALIALIGIVASLISPTSANAGIVIDQQQTANDAFLASFSMSGLAQSFRPQFGNVAGAAVQLWKPGGQTVPLTGNVTIQLFNALSPSATALRSATATGVAQGGWAEVVWSPLAVQPGQTYYLVFTSNNTQLGLAGNTLNPYSRGDAYGNGFQVTRFDYTFKTFYDNQILAAVPEPSSALLGCLAIVAGLGLNSIRTKRRRI